jgi:succinate dehydrogenase hydrophobic anchor subunit
MKISFTRFSIAPVVVLQWVAVAVAIHLSTGCQNIFKDFNAELPGMSAVALQVTQPMVLVPIALAITGIVVTAEALLRSATFRFSIQMIVLFFWLAFACFCVIALAVPLFTLIQKLR